MKRTAFAAAAAALFAVGSAHAQVPMPTVSALYGELGYAFMKIDGAGTTFRPGAIRGIIGWDIHPMFAIEGMLAGGVNDDDKNVIVRGTSQNVNAEVKNMYGIFLKPRYVYNQFELFGRFGYSHTKVNIDSGNGVVNENQSDNDFGWGLGVNYRFNPRMYVGIDWMRYSNQSDHKVDGLTLSFGYHF